jgi:hypothetical protein
MSELQCSFSDGGSIDLEELPQIGSGIAAASKKVTNR